MTNHRLVVGERNILKASPLSRAMASHGGRELCYVPALNDSPDHNKALASLLRRHFGTGRPVRLSLEGGCGLEFRPLIR
jgi:hypothetical protein